MLEHQDTGVSTAQDEPAAKAGKRPRKTKDKTPKASAQDRTVPLIPGVEPAPAKEGATPADRQAFLADGLLALRTISDECGEATAAEMAEAHGWSESMAASICQQLEQRGVIREAREGRGVRWFSESGTGETRIFALAQAGHVGTATWFAEEAIVGVRHAHTLCERLVQERKLGAFERNGEVVYQASYFVPPTSRKPETKPAPKGRTKQLSPEVKAVLSRCAVSGNEVRLPGEQLDRKLYQAVNEALEALGGKWNRKAKAHVFAADPAEALAQVLDEGAFQKAPRDAFEFFPTPPELADRVARELGAEPGDLVLEPSAGDGALIEAVRRSCGDAEVIAVEIDERHQAALLKTGAAVIIDDFLSARALQVLEGRAPFDKALLNPPFSKGQDIDHVWQAWGLLRPGGRLVAIMSGGTTFRSDRKATAFREELVESHGTIEELPEGSFKESGTGVRTVLVVLDKPEEATAPVPRTDAEKLAATAALVDGIEEALSEPTSATTPLASPVEASFAHGLPASRLVTDCLEAVGEPMTLAQIAHETSAPPEEIEKLIAPLLRAGEVFEFETHPVKYALRRTPGTATASETPRPVADAGKPQPDGDGKTASELDGLADWLRTEEGRAAVPHRLAAASAEAVLPLLAPGERSFAWVADSRATIEARLIGAGRTESTAKTYAGNVTKAARARLGAPSAPPAPPPARERGGKPPPPEAPPPAPPGRIAQLHARVARLHEEAVAIAEELAQVCEGMRALAEEETR